MGVGRGGRRGAPAGSVVRKLQISLTKIASSANVGLSSGLYIM